MKRYIRSFTDETINDELIPSFSATKYTGDEMIAMLDDLDNGTPLLVNDSVRWVQAIYLGTKEIQGRVAYMFYDGGFAPWSFTERFIKENTGKIFIVLDDNNPAKVASLLSSLN